MTDTGQSPSPDRLTECVSAATTEAVVDLLNRLRTADVDTRKRALRALKALAEDRPAVFDGWAGPLAAFLTDEERAVRLTTAKLFVTLARTEPAVARPVVDALATRLADDEEFYYVRARCAEALGYVGLDHPESVSDPAILADFRVGLSFDEPEVKEKLAKALAYVALGDPNRLRHHVSSLAEHLEDDHELVRYHLCTALVAVGCEHPSRLAEAVEPLAARLEDEHPYVRGRAAEALGLLVRVDDGAVPALDAIELDVDDAAQFLAPRVAFLRAGRDGNADGTNADEVATVASIREGTEAVVEAMTTPDGTTCPGCGLELSENGPPMCPRCGVPR